MDSPEAPITHHWFDSTHITFGVVTAGLSHSDWKVEASAFRGREPDQHRYDIETGRLDSVATRVSWNPTANWALQASWTRINSPEALEPDDDEARTSFSALYSRDFGTSGSLSATLAWARKDRIPGDALQAWLFEGAVKPDDRWTIFTRAEQVEQDELAGHHGGDGDRAQAVGRRDLRRAVVGQRQAGLRRPGQRLRRPGRAWLRRSDGRHGLHKAEDRLIAPTRKNPRRRRRGFCLVSTF
jgi:hypothetical protein